MMRFLLPSLVLPALVACTPARASSDVVLCGQYQKYKSPSGRFTFGTNQWGDDGSGNECVTISDGGTSFESTWKWTENQLLVHSFPNINLNSGILPLQLSNLSALNITTSWSMVPTNISKGRDLSVIEAAANVVVDMFLDPDRGTANSTTLPKYEVMVWIAAFGGKKPIGFSSSISNPPSQVLETTEFSLYEGTNGNGQYVYSWLAPDNLENFDADISPLLHYLWRNKFIDESNYLGVVQFGTETFHSLSNVTFSTQDFDMSIQSGQPKAVSNGSLRYIPALTWIVIVTITSWVLSV